MAIPIKGQEVSITIVANGQPQASIGDIKSAEFEFMTELITRSYLGQSSDAYDEIFKGFKVTLELNTENQAIFALIQTIIDRAQRRNINVQINIQAVLNYPNGDRPKVYGQDLFFGPMPLGFGSRSEYGNVKLEGTGSNARVVLS
jgi:hypothetical protein